jgi:UDP-N-acetylmuramate dehydrogenase
MSDHIKETPLSDALFRTDISLQPYNNFGVEAKARYFAIINDVAQLPPLAGHLPALPLLILGAGSNILFTRDYPGTVLLNRLGGIHTEWVKQYSAQVTCCAGELWDDIVLFVAEHGWWGAENLSLIPGTVGAAVVQNIGAYGSEISHLVAAVEGIDMTTGRKKTIPGDECRFGYRTSIFKSPEYRSFFITSVTLRFRTWKGQPNLTYPALADLFPERPTHPLEVRARVMQIRRTKLPPVDLKGNAGSFFKNPVVGKKQMEELQEQYPDIPSHPSGEELFKIPAAWLIEQSGMKGVHEGSCGTWPHQPLVIVNYGRATGAEIDRFAAKVAKTVEEKFDIRLEREVITL